MQRLSPLHAVVLIGNLLLACTPARADTVVLKNGNELEGILIEETDSTYRIRVPVGEVTWPKANVLKVVRDTPDQNRLIEQSWRERATTRLSHLATVAAVPLTGPSEGLPPASKGKGPSAKAPAAPLTGAFERARQIADSREETRERVTEERERSANERATRALLERLARDLSPAATFFLKEEGRLSATSQNFIFFYANPESAQRLAVRAEYVFEKVRYDLGAEDLLRPSRRARVVIVENEENWKGWKARASFPHADAFSIPASGEIFILRAGDAQMEQAFAHETAHWVLRMYADKSLSKNTVTPLWLDEGLANYEGAYFSDPAILKQARKSGRFIQLAVLLGLVRYPRDAQHLDLFYAEASSLTEFILTRFGRTAYRGVVDRVLHSGAGYAASGAKDIPAPTAREGFELVIRATGLAKHFPTFDALERAWLESIGT